MAISWILYLHVNGPVSTGGDIKVVRSGFYFLDVAVDLLGSQASDIRTCVIQTTVGIVDHNVHLFVIAIDPLATPGDLPVAGYCELRCFIIYAIGGLTGKGLNSFPGRGTAAGICRICRI